MTDLWAEMAEPEWGDSKWSNTCTSAGWPDDGRTGEDMLADMIALAKNFPPPPITHLVMLSGMYNELLKAATPTVGMRRYLPLGGIELCHAPSIELIEALIGRLRARAAASGPNQVRIGLVVDCPEIQGLAQRYGCRPYTGEAETT